MTSATLGNWDWDNARARFRITLVIATIVHVVVILGVTFTSRDDGKKDIPQSLEVTLVNTQTDKKIDDADFLAQANQEGGGDSEKRARPETVFPATVPADEPEVTNPTPPMFVPAPQQPATRAEFMTQKDSETKMATDMFPVKENPNPEPTPAELISRSMNIASLEAEIGNSLQAYAKLPRNKIVTARTKEYAYASYMDAWRRKVERVGNLNFPAEAKRRNLNGDLILDVIVNVDGTIANIEVMRSSGHKILDDAAMRIVHLAAPYAPFTDEMKKETDVLHIIRTWRFRQGETLEAR